MGLSGVDEQRAAGVRRCARLRLASRAWLLLLLPIMPPSETPVSAPEPEPQDEGYTFDCLQGIGVDVRSASSLPAPTTKIDQAIVFPPGEHPKWNQAWLDAYLSRNPALAGPTVYEPDLPPALSFDFARSQPPNNRTLAEFVLDGTGIDWTLFEITDVQQAAVGQLRLSGTVSDFQPGGEGYVAMMEFFTSLDGLCAPGDGCRGEILRVVPTHSSDRVATGGTDANGNPSYWETVDIEWRIHTPFDYSPYYRRPSFDMRLMAINRLRGLDAAVMMILGRSAMNDFAGNPYIGQEADPLYPFHSKALDGPSQVGRPPYPLPYYNTSFGFKTGVIRPCTPELASRMMFERNDLNGDLKIDSAELVGLVQEINGSRLEQSVATRWLMETDSRYYNVRNRRPPGAVCTYTAEEIEQGCDNRLDFAELKEVLLGFYQSEARCVRKTSEDLFGNPKDEYMCVPWDRCGIFPDPSKPPESGGTMEYQCGFGMCLPDFLHYGSGNVVVPNPGTFRCWDSCEPAEPIERCEFLQDAGFLLDTLNEPVASGGRPLNLSAKIRSYAASCADDYDNSGYKSECEIMRCHYMGTALAQVCDKTNVTLKAPCRSVCEAYIEQLSLPHSLPLHNWTFDADKPPANFSDCESIRPEVDRVTGKLVGQWAYYHCLAATGQGCHNFPEGNCMGPNKYAGGEPCIIGRECASGGCPWAVPGLTSPEDEPVTSTGQDLAGHGGYCCAPGLGDCNGFGLCAKDTGGCHCDEWHEGIDCAEWKMAPWLVAVLLSWALCTALGSMCWMVHWFRWWSIAHAPPKPPKPPKAQPVRKPPRESDTETEDEADTTDEETVDVRQMSAPVTYDSEEPTSIWARSRAKRKKPASGHAVIAVAHYNTATPSRPSKDDAIGRASYVTDGKAVAMTGSQANPEPPPGLPLNPRVARFSSDVNSNEAQFLASRDAAYDAEQKRLRKEAKNAATRRRETLTEQLQQKQKVRNEGSWEFREGEGPEERRLRLLEYEDAQREAAKTPENEQRKILVAVLECRDLKRMDGRFGDNDVFVEVAVEQSILGPETLLAETMTPEREITQVQKTDVLYSVGVAPKWENGAGQPLLFDDFQKGPVVLQVGVFDKDQVINQEIGRCVIDGLPDCEVEDWAVCSWYPIFDFSEERTGQVRLFIRYATPLLEQYGAPREWELEATVIACKDLPSQDLGGLGNNEVYVKLEAMGSQWPRQTSTVNSAAAGRTRSESKVGAIARTLTRVNKHYCSWGQDGEGELKVIELCDVPPALGVSVFDEDQNSEDDLIGQCVVEVGAQISAHAQTDVHADVEEETDAEAGPDWSTEGWFDLTESKRGKKVGEIQLKVAWRRKQYDQASSSVDDDETSSLVEEIDDTIAVRE